MLAKLKFNKKNQSSNLAIKSNNWLYVKIHKVMNNINQKSKPKFNMMTQGPSRKQIIISMSMNNTERIIIQSNMHIVKIFCNPNFTLRF